MRIAAARAIPVRLRFTRPVRTAVGDFVERPSVLLALSDAEGFTGLGEAAPWPGFGTENLADALAALREVAAMLPGSEAELDRLPPPGIDRLRDAPAARAALEGALLDLEARRQGRPMADCLASRSAAGTGDALRVVAVNALLIERDPNVLREEAALARARGYRAAKLKLGAETLAEDVARAAAARAGLGPDVALRGDANGAWSVEKAREALAALAEFQFDYVEQPVAATDFAGLASLRGRAPVRIAADESVATGHGATRLIEAAAADVLVLKPAMLGGAAQALEIAARARRAGCEVVFSHAFESAVGAQHALHCAAAWGDTTTVHGLETAGLFVEDVGQPVESSGGFVGLSGGPGIGIDLDRALLRETGGAG